MTGRDLIIYILQNNLEDKEVFENGRLLGFMTCSEAAVKFNVGIATILVWVDRGQIPGIKIAKEIFIPANAVSPIKGDTNVKKEDNGFAAVANRYGII